MSSTCLVYIFISAIEFLYFHLGNDEYPVTTIIIVAVLGGLIAIGLIIVVLRIVRKKDSRDEIRKLYSIDVEADHYMNDDLDVALIEAPAVRTDGVISTVTTNAFSEKSVLYTRTLQDYETSDEETWRQLRDVVLTTYRHTGLLLRRIKF